MEFRSKPKSFPGALVLRLVCIFSYPTRLLGWKCTEGRVAGEVTAEGNSSRGGAGR